MSSPFQPLSDPNLIEVATRLRAKHRRWWWIGGIAVLTPIAFLLIGAISVVVWFSLRHRTATREVLKEVARVQAQGEPITTDDMYAYHVVAPDVRDITPLWIAALDSFDEKQLAADGADVPIVGQGDSAMRQVDHDKATLAATEQFIRKYQSTIELALKASQAQGECRFPVQFEEGMQALLPYPQKMRQLTRLLSLRMQCAKVRGDREQAIESLEAIFAAARSLNHELVIVEQLVGLAIGGVALIETEKLLNDIELTDEELARLSTATSSMRVEQGLTCGLMGERAIGYHSFYHLGQVMDNNDPAKPFPGEGQLTLPVDCRFYLEVMGESIEASRKPYPDALIHADKIDANFRTIMKNRLSMLSYTVTLLLAPALHAAFEATARNVARREAMLCALAAERHRLKRGELPAKLADLVPEFLPAVPTDPFDGQPLRMLERGDELLFYSVGKDRKDDGGVENNHTAEPDIVVTLKRRSK